MDYNVHGGIDLHIHTTASDGSFSPPDVLRIAHQIGLGAIAITDHDTIEGAREARQAGIPEGLDFLNGVEISAAPPPTTPFSGSMHLLGYGIDLNDATLNRKLQRLQKARKDRNPGIIERLNMLGFELTLDEVARCAAGGPIGRPHIARVMVQKGFVDTIDMAFDNFLAPGRPAYVDKYRLPVQDAIAAIQGAGGIAILAHPGLLGSDRPEQIEQLICELKQMGLGGLEVYYPEHSSAQTAHFKQLAHTHTLLITGGTDFHGQLNPGIQLGRGRGDLYVPLHLYKQLVFALPRVTDSS